MKAGSKSIDVTMKETALRNSACNSPAMISIAPANAADAPAIKELLRSAGLPYEDIGPHLAHFLVAKCEKKLVGAIGAEVYGAHALLRSLVVSAADRGSGQGDKLLRALETAAETWGVTRWWLLTTTAESFFVKRGFRIVSRSDAPMSIASTEQFRGACPSIAVCLSRERRSP